MRNLLNSIFLALVAKEEGYPTDLTTGKTGSVIVGVVNHEYNTIKPGRYSFMD